MKDKTETVAERVDAWLCVRLKPRSLRIYWHRLWIRKDEFHPSLQIDQELMKEASESQESYNRFLHHYYFDLDQRRKKAHQRSLA